MDIAATRKQLVNEYARINVEMKEMKRNIKKLKNQIHVGFLFASPII